MAARQNQIMIVHTFSAQPFNNRQELNFCPEKYSKFKYGSKNIAREFGRELGKKFIDSLVYDDLQRNFDLSQIPILVSSAPYKFTPTASSILKDYFIQTFNKTHTLKFSKSVEEMKIYRAHSYFTEYDSMSKEDRDNAINSDDFYIDKNLIKGKILFLIDDIKITGSHQLRIENLLRSVNFTGQVVFLFYAELIGDEDPRIEGFLNRKAISNLKDINEIIREDEFIFNTRVVKFILQNDSAEFTNFIQFQSKKFNETLLHFSLGNEYFKDPAFQKNLLTLESYLDCQI